MTNPERIQKIRELLTLTRDTTTDTSARIDCAEALSLLSELETEWAIERAMKEREIELMLIFRGRTLYFQNGLWVKSVLKSSLTFDDAMNMDLPAALKSLLGEEPAQ